MNNFLSQCTPVQVFLIIAIINIINDIFFIVKKSNNKTFMIPSYVTLIVKIIIYVLYFYLLRSLCKHKLNDIAWIILVLPFLFIFFIIMNIISTGIVGLNNLDKYLNNNSN